MRTAKLAVLLFIIAAVPAATLAQDEKKKTDALQGTWELKSFKQGGTEDPDFVKDNSPKLVCEGEKYEWKAGAASEKGTIKLGMKDKLLTLDFMITEGNDKDKTQVGIYKIEGDELTICFNRPGAAERPKKFESKEDAPEFILATLKRRKKE